MNARDWLHLMGIHHWGKWSESKVIGSRVPNLSYLDYDGWHNSDKIDVIGQDRYCLICNKKQLKEMTL